MRVLFIEIYNKSGKGANAGPIARPASVRVWPGERGAEYETSAMRKSRARGKSPKGRRSLYIHILTPAGASRLANRK